MSPRDAMRRLTSFLVANLDIKDCGSMKPAGCPLTKTTGNRRAVQVLLGNAKSKSTPGYLFVYVEDAVELLERTDL